MDVNGQVHASVAAISWVESPVSIKYESRWVLLPVCAMCRKENILPVPGIEPPFRGLTAHTLLAVPTELSRLSLEIQRDTNDVKRQGKVIPLQARFGPAGG
jgi:hypothetical protein